MRTITEIAAAEGMDLGQASKIARLTQLAPAIIEDCLARPDHGLALEHLMRRRVPGDWDAQRAQLEVRA